MRKAVGRTAPGVHWYWIDLAAFPRTVHPGAFR